jgi:serine/threonine-protein kinase
MASTPTAPFVGGRYRILDLVGQGRHTEVYRVSDQGSDGELALKRLRPSAQGDPALAASLKREYRLLAALRHPAIVEVLAQGADDDGPYFTMELLECPDWSRQVPLPWSKVCEILYQLAEALGTLHARGLVHRSISVKGLGYAADGRGKLLDYQALGLAGVGPLKPGGEAPYLAPEALFTGLVDCRADVFALGAVAYYLLTGQHAYGAQDFSGLPVLWSRPVPGPAQLVPDIPAPIDQLVSQMLRREPVRRPAHAGEVMEALAARANLPAQRQSPERGARSLVSSVFVGRQPLLAQWRQRLNQVSKGKGAALVLSGGTGAGKSRLLNEMVLQASCRGAVTVLLDHLAWQGVHNALEALALQLLDEAPEAARRTAELNAPTLAALGPSVAQRFQLDYATVGDDNQTAAIIAALLQWVWALGQETEIVVAVDNVDRLDELSRAFLVSLSRSVSRAKVILLAAWPDQQVLPPGLRALGEASARVELTGLSSDEVLLLTKAVFGQVAQGRQFALWLQQEGQGNPLWCVDAIRLLVDRGAIRYHDEKWSLPAEPPAEELPRGVDEILALRLDRLSPRARGLVARCALAQGVFTEELLHSVEPTFSTEDLDEAIQQGVLRKVEGYFAFNHAALRRQAAAVLSETERLATHQGLAHYLRSHSGGDASVQARAGWHMIQGGELEAARGVVGEIEELTNAGSRPELEGYVEYWEAALEASRQQSQPADDQVPLLGALVQASYRLDRTLATTYGEAALSLLARLSGLALAGRLQRIVGRPLALFVALSWARLRWAVAGPGRLGPSFGRILQYLWASATYLCGVATICFDAAQVQRIAEVLEPFAGANRRHAGAGVRSYCQCLATFGSEHPLEGLEAWRRFCLQCDDDHSFSLLRPGNRRDLRGGALYARGILAAYGGQADALTCADDLSRMGSPFYSMVAHQVRAIYHALRGELDLAATFRQQVEVLAIKSGSVWQAELWESVFLTVAATETHDGAMLATAVDRLSVLALELPGLRRYQLVARGAQALVAGEPNQATVWFEQAVADDPPRGFLGWGPTVGFWAAALNAQGDHEAARDLCRTAVDALAEDDLQAAPFLRVQAEQVVAEAGVGHVEEARQLFTRLSAALADKDAPLVQGTLRLAGARMSLLGEDQKEFERALPVAQKWCTMTGAKGLLDLCTELQGLAAKKGWGRTSNLVPPPQIPPLIQSKDLEVPDAAVFDTDVESSVNALTNPYGLDIADDPD